MSRRHRPLAGRVLSRLPRHADFAAWTSRLALLTMALLAVTAFAFRRLGELSGAPAPGVEPEVLGLERFFFVAHETSFELVLPVFLWMLFRRRRRLQAHLGQPGGLFPAGALLFAGGTLFVWAYAVDLPTLLVPSLALLVLGGGSFLAGWGGLRTLLVPVLLLLLAWPLPGVLINYIVFPLQMLAAQLAALSLSVLGITHTLSGDLIYTNGRVFQVIETCSGLRSIETLLLAALVYGELLDRRGWRLALLVILAPAVGIATNAIRVLSIILNPHSDLAAVHTTQGLITIALGVLILAGLDRLFDALRPERRQESSRSMPEALAGEPQPQPVRWFALVSGLTALGVLALVIPPPAASWTREPAMFKQIPMRLGEWTGQNATVDQQFLGTIYFSDRVSRTYRLDERKVDLFIASDDHRHPLLSLISPKTAFLHPGSIVEERRRVELEGRTAEELVLRFRKTRELAYRWHENTSSVAVEAARSALAIDRSPFRRNGSARVYRIATQISQDPDGRARAEARLRRFARLLAGTPLLLDSPREQTGPSRANQS